MRTNCTVLYEVNEEENCFENLSAVFKSQLGCLDRKKTGLLLAESSLKDVYGTFCGLFHYQDVVYLVYVVSPEVYIYEYLQCEATYREVQKFELEALQQYTYLIKVLRHEYCLYLVFKRCNYRAVHFTSDVIVTRISLQKPNSCRKYPLLALEKGVHTRSFNQIDDFDFL